MLLIISPSKTQDFSTSTLACHTTPTLLDHTCELIAHLQKLEVDQISTLMKTSEKLSQSTWQRFHDFQVPFHLKNAKQALLAFKGDVYSGITVEKYSQEDFDFAQNHLRILSGLYGILKPLDLIQPYRLEMSTALVTDKGQNLYPFWREVLTDEVNTALAQFSEPVLVNLASQEYFKALLPGKLTSTVVSVSFKEKKNDSYRVVAIHAKRARGAMVNFVIKNRLAKVADMTSFSEDGYWYNEDLSSAAELVFCRG